MEGTTIDVLSSLVDLFFRFGPFFLALFLSLVLLTKARAWYNEAVVRQNPPATEEEKETYRFYFLGSLAASAVVFSMALVVWWLLNMKPDHTYQIAVLDIPQNVNLDSRYFYRDSFRQTPAGGMARDKYFLIDQPAPFRPHQRFLFDYYAQPQSGGAVLAKGAIPIQLSVEYRGKSSDSFRVEMQKGRPILVSDEPSGGAIAGLTRSLVTRVADTGTPRPTRFESGRSR
jgi:hypothetical protein